MTLKADTPLVITPIRYKSQGIFLEALIIERVSSKNKKQPVVLFLHGHRSNAWESVWFGAQLAHAGFTALIPTQRGYRFSQGKRDFCGPKTVRGVLDGADLFLKKYKNNKHSIGVWGISRGAKVAALLAEQNPDLFNAAVFQSGGYDLKTEIKTTLPSIRKVILQEIKNNRAEIEKRSPLKGVGKIKCPVLVLHGAADDRILKNQAEMLDEKLREGGVPHQTHIIKKQGHFITEATIEKYTIPFLKKYLKNKSPLRR